MKTINVITLCSGYDSQCLGLRYGHIPFDLVAWCEILPIAIQAHDAIFPEYSDRNLGDMTKVDWSKYKGKEIDLLTYSTPCQDISNEGAKKGLIEGTRSSILWDTERAIKDLRPKVLLQENVKALVNCKNAPNFERWRNILEGYGYKNYYAVLNSKEYGGIPQNRERVFMVSLRADYDHVRGGYNFPDKTERCLNIDDIVDEIVDDKYYKLSDIVYQKVEKCEGFIKVPQATKKGYIECPFGGVFDMSFPNSKNRRGRVQDNGSVCPTIQTGNASQLIYVEETGRMRNFSDREIFRLMGVQDYHIDQIQMSGLSTNQQYFLAGNSIVVPVIARVLRNAFC